MFVELGFGALLALPSGFCADTCAVVFQLGRFWRVKGPEFFQSESRPYPYEQPGNSSEL